MQNLPNGKTMFSDLSEMNYFLFLEIGLALDSNQRMYDTDTGITIKYEDKYIKATATLGDIYAGKDEVLFNPAENYKLMNMLFGYFLEKYSCYNEDEFKFIATYIDKIEPDKFVGVVQYKDVNNTIKKIFTLPYFNIYLCLIELIFSIGGNFEVDLSNFDIPKEI